MSQRASRPGRLRQRSRRSAQRRLATRFSQLAGLALCVHLLLAAHGVSHLSYPSAEGLSQPCAICSVGQSSLGARAVAPVLSWAAAASIEETAVAQAAPASRTDGASLARAPPSPASSQTGPQTGPQTRH